MISMMTRTAKVLLVALAASFALPALAEETATPAAAPVIEDFSLGSPDAKVKIVEYASFTCPHCADFHAESFAKLKAEYIDTGKVHFTLREVYFDRYGLWAAMVARCGGDMKYFFIQDILFHTQKEWAGSDDATVVVDNLKKIARTAGMEDAVVDACLKDSEAAKAMVARFEANMAADGVEGTPAIFINGSKHSNMPYADLKALIDTELAK
jgi:protein-disulfide isomerase